jgi:hypothetical protein
VVRWISGVAVGVALMVMAVGCGGGGDSSTEVTKAEFTKQANSICAEGKKTRKAAFDNYNKEVEEKRSGANQVPKLEQQLANEMIDESVVPSLKEQLAQLEKLGVPAADEAEISKMLRNLTKAVGELEDGGVRQLVKGGKLATFQEEAEGYGLNCTLF